MGWRSYFVVVLAMGFSVGDELGFAEALSNTDEADNQRRSTSDGQDLQNLRSVAMGTGRSSGARSPQLSWNMPAGLGGTAGVIPGSPGVLPGSTGPLPGAVPPFKPLATKDSVVPPFSALPPSIARIPVIKPAAPPVFKASLQQMSNRRFQQVSPTVTEMPLKNSIVVGSVEALPSPMQQVAPPSLQQIAAPSLQRPSVRQTAANEAANLASKTKVLQSALHHGTYDGFDLTSPSPLLMGHSLQSLSKASNISVEALAAALRLREQQLLSALTSTTTTTTSTTTTTTTTPPPTKPATVKPKYPMVGPNRVMNAPKEYYPVSYDQNYDDNFTSKVELPDTTFSCGDQKHFPGLYADEDLGCMVFHVCAFTDDGMVMKSFLCPESTLFDQSILKCNWWFYVDCKASKRLYDSNIPISKSYQLMKALAFFSAYKNQTSNNT